MPDRGAGAEQGAPMGGAVHTVSISQYNTSFYCCLLDNVTID